MAYDKDILINEKSMEVLVAKFIPTSQYFERSFEVLQTKIGDLKDAQKGLKQDMNQRFAEVDVRSIELKTDINLRFEQVDKRFEQVDKRFEQVDKRFEQVDKRFEQVNKRFDKIENKLDTLIDKIDIKIDSGLRENRNISIRLFTFAMIFSAVSMAGLLSKVINLF